MTFAALWAGLSLAGCELLVGNDPAVTGDGGGVGAGSNDDAGSNQEQLADASVGDDSTTGSDGSSSTTSEAGSGGDAAATGSDAATAGQDATAPASDAGAGKSDATTSLPDAAADAMVTSGGDGGPLCGMTVPAGFSLAIFNSDITTPCPSSFQEHIVDGPATAGAGACSCGCTVTQQGTCSHGAITLMGAPGHGVDTCTSPWSSAPAGSSTCITVPAVAFDSISATVSGTGSGAGGACTTQPTSNPAAVTAPTQRYCDVPSSSADAICGGNAPAGFSACIVASGDVACPASTPFTQKFSVQAPKGETLTCGSCSACTVSTACGNPTIDVFANGTCAGTPSVQLPANGTCIGGGEQAFSSVAYNASPSTTCSGGTSTATVKPTAPQTICCR